MIPALDPTEIAFRHFWLAYPFKIAVAEARVAFKQALKLTTAQNLIESAHRFAKDANRDSAFTPYPARWLAQQRWFDGPLPPRKLSPEELAEKAALEAIRRNDLERERSIALGLELEEMRARAVPMPEDMREQISAHKLPK